MLFLAKDPHGDAQMVRLLKGDILATTSASLTWMLVTFGAAVLALFAFRKELLLVSFDRDLAVVFGKRAGLWDVVLYLLIGVVISLGVMAAGPMATFGFLVVPPVTVRLVTRRMLTFSLGSAALGAVTAFVGFYCAYRYDLPLGPAEVALASAALLAVGTAAALRARSSRAGAPRDGPALALLHRLGRRRAGARDALDALGRAGARADRGDRGDGAGVLLRRARRSAPLAGARVGPPRGARPTARLELGVGRAAPVVAGGVPRAAGDRVAAMAGRRRHPGGGIAVVAWRPCRRPSASARRCRRSATRSRAVAAPAARAALLYALNTLGGAAGIAAAGFGLPALIGVRASYGAVAATSIAVGVSVLALAVERGTALSRRS